MQYQSILSMSIVVSIFILCSWTALHVRDPLGLLVQLYDFLAIGGTLLINMFYAEVRSPGKDIPPIDHVALQAKITVQFGTRVRRVDLPGRLVEPRMFFVGGFVELLADLAAAGYDICLDQPATVKQDAFATRRNCPCGPFVRECVVPRHKLACASNQQFGVDLGIRRHSREPLRLPVRYALKSGEGVMEFWGRRFFGDGRKDECYSVLYDLDRYVPPRLTLLEQQQERSDWHSGALHHVWFMQPSGDLATWTTCCEHRLAAATLRQSGLPEAAADRDATFVFRSPYMSHSQILPLPSDSSSSESELVTCRVDHGADVQPMTIDPEVAQTKMDLDWADTAQAKIEAFVQELHSSQGEQPEVPVCTHACASTDRDQEEPMDDVYVFRFGGVTQKAFVHASSMARSLHLAAAGLRKLATHASWQQQPCSSSNPTSISMSCQVWRTLRFTHTASSSLLASSIWSMRLFRPWHIGGGPRRKCVTACVWRLGGSMMSLWTSFPKATPSRICQKWRRCQKRTRGGCARSRTCR